VEPSRSGAARHLAALRQLRAGAPLRSWSSGDAERLIGVSSETKGTVPEPADRRRHYGEVCPIALALDVVGDRWALLLLRELFAGPKRFTDLAGGLPGVGTAVLSERLRQLERHGIVSRRRLGPPAPALVYQLTSRGLALDPVLTSLARWGAVYLTGQDPLDVRGRWLLQAMAATVTTPPPGIETTNFILDGQECHVLVTGERTVARDGLRADARITVRATVPDLYALATSARPAAASARRLAVEGDRRAAERLLDHLILGFRQAATDGRTGP
jgi:DNA-binding HxlR family transcriptional regulator